MNRPPGAPSRPNPQLLAATRLVVEVTRDLEARLPRAQRQGSVSVGERRLEGWQTDLQTAVTQLQGIPIIMIYPPPPIARYIQGAVLHINQARVILGSIPIASTRIYPPQPGRANITLQTLQQILGHLHEALAILNQALRTG